MKKLLSILAASSFLLAYSAKAADEVTLETTATCAKCDLGTASDCQDNVKIEGKWHELTGPGAKGFHKNICKGEKKVTVTGKMEGDKFVASKVEVK